MLADDVINIPNNNILLDKKLGSTIALDACTLIEWGSTHGKFNTLKAAIA